MLYFAAKAIVTVLTANMIQAVGTAPKQPIVEFSKGTFDCSAAAGKYTQADIGQVYKGNAIAGRITFLRGQSGSVYNGAGAFAFLLNDGSAVGAYLTVVERDRNHLYLMLKPQHGSESILVSRLDGDEAHVRVVIDKRGRLIVRSGGVSKAVQMRDPKVIGRVVQCQSGKFQFTLGN